MDKLDIDHLIHLANTDPQAFYQVRMALIQQTMSGLTNIPASKLADLQNTIDSTRALAVTPSSAAKQLTNLLDDRHEALRMLWEELEVRLRKLAEAMPNGKSPED